MVRLKPMSEFRHLFEQPKKFILIPAVEISDAINHSLVHVNAINLHEFIPPQSGNTIFEVMENNINAVYEQRKKNGQLMFPTLNHPNFFLGGPHDHEADDWWGHTAEDIAKIKKLIFFEVFNGPFNFNIGFNAHLTDVYIVWCVPFSNGYS